MGRYMQVLSQVSRGRSPSITPSCARATNMATMMEAPVARQHALKLTCLAFLFILALMFPRAAFAVSLVTLWYLCMSAFDWALHKHVLHNDDSLIQEWRQAHYVHHREFDGAMSWKTGASLTFPHPSSAGIVLATMPVALLIGTAWVSAFGEWHQLLYIALAHAVGITIAVGIHNAAHSSFHDYPIPSWRKAPCVPVPKAIQQIIHEHHEHHHLDARTNLCTVLLGFDHLVGTAWVPRSVEGEAELYADCIQPGTDSWTRLDKAGLQRSVADCGIIALEDDEKAEAGKLAKVLEEEAAREEAYPVDVEKAREGNGGGAMRRATPPKRSKKFLSMGSGG